jgi:ferrochelatase
VFTAHSVPDGMAAASGSPSAGTLSRQAGGGPDGGGRRQAGGGPDGGGRYAVELREAARLITERARPAHPDFDLVYQSRSGPPSVPWLGPDICDHLTDIAGKGVPGAVVVPVGFTSDHMEVVHDLDVEAAGVAQLLGLTLARAAAPMPDPRFAAMVTGLVTERMGKAAPAWLGDLGPAAADCPADCCRYHPGRPGIATSRRGLA